MLQSKKSVTLIFCQIFMIFLTKIKGNYNVYVISEKKAWHWGKGAWRKRKRAWRRTMLKLARGKAIDCILKKVFIASKNAQHALLDS